MGESDAALTAELNDLLRLDHDAVQAHTLAIKLLENPDYKRQLEEFRGGHQRHIDELSQLIRSRDGVPLDLPHLPSGAFQLAVQAIGAVGGDRSVLLAFKANERHVRDKYRRSARAVHPADVTSVLARGAEDEARHYEWALETLSELGVTLRDDIIDNPIGSALLAVGVGFFAATIFGGARAVYHVVADADSTR